MRPRGPHRGAARGDTKREDMEDTAEQRAAIQNERTCAPADYLEARGDTKREDSGHDAEQRAAIQNESP